MCKVFFLINFFSLAIFSTDYPHVPIKINQECMYNIFAQPIKNISISFFSRFKRKSKPEPDVLKTIGKSRLIKLNFMDNFKPLINISLENPNYQNKIYEIITLNKDEDWDYNIFSFTLDYHPEKYSELYKLLPSLKKEIKVYLLIKITYPDFEPITIFYEITCKGKKYEISDIGRSAKSLGAKKENYSFRLSPCASYMNYYIGNINFINSDFSKMPISLLNRNALSFNDNDEELERMLDEQEQAIKKAEENGVIFTKTSF